MSAEHDCRFDPGVGTLGEQHADVTWQGKTYELCLRCMRFGLDGWAHICRGDDQNNYYKHPAHVPR